MSTAHEHNWPGRVEHVLMADGTAGLEDTFYADVLLEGATLNASVTCGTVLEVFGSTLSADAAVIAMVDGHIAIVMKEVTCASIPGQ